MSKLQASIDKLHETLASDEATGNLSNYFKETFHDHSESRAQVDKEVMILEDIILDPFHLKTWESTIKGLIFSSPERERFQVEFFILSQMEIIPDVTMKAPAAVSMFKNDVFVSAKIPSDVTQIINEQLKSTSVSQAGYLYINPFIFWQIIDMITPIDIAPSVSNKDFIAIINRAFTELMLHEVNHHINGHTILNVSSYSPLKSELAAKYKNHTFQLGEFKATSESSLANIIEDYAINEYLEKELNYPDEIPSLFDVGVSDRCDALSKSEHSITKQSFNKEELKDIDTSVFERIQLFTDSDINIPSQNKPSSHSIPKKDPSSLAQLCSILTQEGSSDSDIHSLNESKPQSDQDDASESLRLTIEKAEDETQSQPGMRGADYNRTIKPTTKTKKLPDFGLKLRKLNRLLSKKSHVNWTMPHQVLTTRLDLHRVERNPKQTSIHAWIDTSGSMSTESLNDLLGLIISNYVDSAKETPIILHTVSYNEVGDPITLTSKKDLKKLQYTGLASNGGTSFEEILASLPTGRNIIMSDFEWNETDVSNNTLTLSNNDKNILWINTSRHLYNKDVTDVIRKLPTSIYLNLSDYKL